MGSNYTKKPNNRSSNKKNNYKKKHYSYEINGNKHNRNIGKNKGKNKKNNSYSKNTREDFNKIEYHQIPLENNIEEKDNSINFIEDKIDNWLKENNNYINKEENQDETVNIEDGYNNNEITSEIELKKELPIEENYSLEEPILTKKVKTEENVTYNTPTKEEYTNQELKRLRPRFLYFLGPLLLVLLLLGTTYAFFTYYKEGEREADVAAGEVYVKLSSNTAPSINIDKAYPRTVSEARERTDNCVDFVILTKNTSSTTAVIYDLDLEEGEDQSGTRIDSEYLRFDLSLIGDNNSETLLMDAVDYETFNNNDLSALFNVPINTNQEVSTTYRLRMWISDEVIISDDDGIYTSDEFNELYANISLKIDTFVSDTSLPLSVRSNHSYVENSTSYLMATITNEHLLEDAGKFLAEDDTVSVEITNPDNNIIFNYTDNKGNSVTTGLSSVDKTYSFNKNEGITMKVFVKEENNNNIDTTIHFKVSKNGVVIKEYDQLVSIIGTNYCGANGFNRLADCILLMENNAKTISDAKAQIVSKGAPNVNDTAPSYTYIEKDTTDGSIQGAELSTKWYFADSYTFDASTGTFTLTNSNGDTVNDTNNQKDLSSDYVGYYTFGANTTTSGTTISRVKTVDTATNSITTSRKTSEQAESLDSQVGLYAVEDDLGTSYIYRGNVNNNNVQFGGYFWKILRINGDGTIRMIFNGGGNSLPADGGKMLGNNAAISNSEVSGYGSAYVYNYSSTGPTYVGYMFNEEASATTSNEVSNNQFESSSTYYWGESYTTSVDANGVTWFQLSQGEHSYSFITATLTTMQTATSEDYHGEVVSQLSLTPYTCKATDSSGTLCTTLYKVNSITNSTTANVNYITMSPITDDKTVIDTNTIDSNAKKQLETWYENNLMDNLNNGNAVSTYVVDNIWCNDRSILTTYKDSTGVDTPLTETTGYLLTNSTHYAAKTRLITTSLPYKNAIIRCNINDRFSSTLSFGNGGLNYPIGLITADEYALAGGMVDWANNSFYLKTNGYYWLMTPSTFDSTSGSASVFRAYPNGELNSSVVSNTNGLRAVINLKDDVLIDSGDGSASNPYTIQ